MDAAHLPYLIYPDSLAASVGHFIVYISISLALMALAYRIRELIVTGMLGAASALMLVSSIYVLGDLHEEIDAGKYMLLATALEIYPESKPMIHNYLKDSEISGYEYKRIMSSYGKINYNPSESMTTQEAREKLKDVVGS